MSRQEIVQRLAEHRSQLEALGVSSLALFGSTARNEASDSSDVDLLVEFGRRVTLFDFFEVQEYLESLLGTDKVDLVMRRAVIEELKETIYGEAIPCFDNSGSSVSATS